MISFQSRYKMRSLSFVIFISSFLFFPLSHPLARPNRRGPICWPRQMWVERVTLSMFLRAKTNDHRQNTPSVYSSSKLRPSFVRISIGISDIRRKRNRDLCHSLQSVEAVVSDLRVYREVDWCGDSINLSPSCWIEFISCSVNHHRMNWFEALTKTSLSVIDANVRYALNETKRLIKLWKGRKRKENEWLCRRRRRRLEQQRFCISCSVYLIPPMCVADQKTTRRKAIEEWSRLIRASHCHLYAQK